MHSDLCAITVFRPSSLPVAAPSCPIHRLVFVPNALRALLYDRDPTLYKSLIIYYYVSENTGDIANTSNNLIYSTGSYRELRNSVHHINTYTKCAEMSDD